MKGATTALVLMVLMSFTSYSFSQNVNYQSNKNNQCSWNQQSQTKDVCRESFNDVQIAVNREEARVFITIDGNISVFRIDDEQVINNPTMEFSLTSADGTSWKMIIKTLENTVWLDMNNSRSTDSISYIF